MLKNIVFRVLEFPGKKICKKTLSRVVGLRDDLSLSTKLFRHKHTTTTTTVQYDDDDSSESPLTEEEEEEEEEKERCVFLLVVFFCLLLVLCCWPVLLRIQFVFGETD